MYRSIMMQEFSLRKPIKTESGEEIKVLSLDWDNLSFADLASAGKVKSFLGFGQQQETTISPKLDNNLRISIAWIAAVKGKKGLVIEDCLKLSLADALDLSDECIDAYLMA